MGQSSENLLTNMKWRSQDPRITKTLNRMAGQDDWKQMLKEIKIYFLPWNIRNKIRWLNFILFHEKINVLKCISCVQNILYIKAIFSFFFSSSSFLRKQFCHCPGCSGRQKTWSVLKKSSSYWLLREPQNMMWPLSYFWLMPQITCPVGLTWICLTKVSDYFKY